MRAFSTPDQSAQKLSNFKSEFSTNFTMAIFLPLIIHPAKLKTATSFQHRNCQPVLSHFSGLRQCLDDAVDAAIGACEASATAEGDGTE
jgi:hypothetical protein